MDKYYMDGDFSTWIRGFKYGVSCDYNQKPIIKKKSRKKRPEYIKNGHIVCPFEGFEKLHEERKPKINSRVTVLYDLFNNI